jgi:hypothetical protein
MFIQKIKHAVLGTAVAGALFAGMASPAAAAGIQFTWNPNATSVPLSGPGTTFTADDINVFDYAVINLPSDPTVAFSVVENGFLKFSSFGLLGSSIANPAGFNGAAGSDPYQLYISFTSTSHLTQVAPGIFTGAFDSLSYTLWGDVLGNDSFTVAANSPSASNLGDDLALASGVLDPTGLNQANILNGIPQANVQTTFTENPAQAGFFVNPPSIITLFLEASFTNTTQVVSTAACGLNTCISINGGGGNADFLTKSIPEPGTLSLVGLGLLGFGFFGAKRRSRA